MFVSIHEPKCGVALPPTLLASTTNSANVVGGFRSHFAKDFHSFARPNKYLKN